MGHKIDRFCGPETMALLCPPLYTGLGGAYFFRELQRTWIHITW